MGALKFNFDSRQWKSYLAIIGKHVDHVHIKQTGDHIVINDELRIKPPKLQSIPEKINQLRHQRMEKYYEYHDIYNEILYSDDDSVSRYKKEYQQIVDSINQTEDEIIGLMTLQRSIDDYFGKKLDSLVEELGTITHRNGLLKQQFRDEVSIDQTILNQYTEDFLEIRRKQDEIYHEELRDYPDYYIVDLPETSNAEGKRHHPHANRKSEKKYKHIDAEQAREIKRSVKRLISEMFKFETLEQCLDKSRSTMYWMSKSDIIKLINDNDKLQGNMPKGYRKMNREELCNNIEKLRRGNVG